MIATAVPSTATWYDVPAGTPAAKCRGESCHARIFWAKNPKTGALIPIDCDVPGGVIPSDTDDPAQIDMLTNNTAHVQIGRGVSHFLTCPDADEFSGGRRASRR